jgi:hypothetical protein
MLWPFNAENEMVRLITKRLLQMCGRSRYRGYTLWEQKYRPMLRLLKELKRRGVDLGELRTLEIFGRDGLDHTTTYAREVKSLEVWEIDPKWHADLVKNLPGASIRIVDSYEELGRSTSKFEFIVVDNAIGNLGAHCDHFDLFPDSLFKVTSDESLLVLIIIPHIDSKTLKHFPDLLDTRYLAARKSFYAADDPMSIPADQIVGVYRSFIEKNHYRLVWSYRQNRSGAGVDYLVLKIKKK